MTASYRGSKVGTFVPPRGYQFRFAIATASFIAFRTRPLVVTYAICLAVSAAISGIDIKLDVSYWWIGPVVVLALFLALYLGACCASLRKTVLSDLYVAGESVRVTLDANRLLVSLGRGYGAVDLDIYKGVRTGFGLVLLGTGSNTLTLPKESLPSDMLTWLRERH